MSTSWLQKQKKGDLQEMAKQSGLADGDELLKDELVEQLNIHLRLPVNETKLSTEPLFEEYYSKLSPTKKSIALKSDEDKPPRKRKQSLKVKEELDTLTTGAVDSSKALVAKTPRAIQKVAARVPLPASPADVTDYVDRQTEVVRRRLSNAYETSGAETSVEWTRDFLGSVEGIIFSSTLIEALSLRRITFPWDSFTSHAYNKAGDTFTFYYPNPYKILDADFWNITTLWVLTSIIIPAFFAFFVNLTRPKHHGLTTRRSTKSHYPFDPLTFNVVKGVLAYAVYGQFFNLFGTFSSTTIAATHVALIGGYPGLLITSGVGALASLYDAVLKK